MNKRSITMKVNGVEITSEVEPRVLLTDFVRDELELTGTHIGCEHGVCGACTILLNGEPVRSCIMLAVQADGCEVQTVESLAATSGELHPLQQAFLNNHALQCGFCTPGFLMTIISFLEENPNPTNEEIKVAISGNLCRCTGYTNIVKAVKEASELMAKEGA